MTTLAYPEGARSAVRALCGSPSYCRSMRSDMSFYFFPLKCATLVARFIIYSTPMGLGSAGGQLRGLVWHDVAGSWRTVTLAQTCWDWDSCSYSDSRSCDSHFILSVLTLSPFTPHCSQCSPHALYLIQRHLTHRQLPNRRPRNKLSRSLMRVLGIFHTPWHFLGGFE